MPTSHYNPQQILPLAIVAFEAHAFSYPKRRDQAALDLLAGLPGSSHARRYSQREDTLLHDKALDPLAASQAPAALSRGLNFKGKYSPNLPTKE